MGILRIDGIVGDMFNTAEDIRFQVEEMNMAPNDELHIYIQSEGGSVFEGFKIYNYLRTLPQTVFTHGNGLIGSIATLLMLAAKKENTFISEVSMFMVHRAIDNRGGNQDELAKAAEVLNSIDEILISVYSERTGMSRDAIEVMMADTTWLSGEQAVKQGFVGQLENTIPVEAVAKAQFEYINQKSMGFTESLKRFINKAEPTAEQLAKAAKIKADEHEEDEEKKAKIKADEHEEDEDKDMKKALAEALAENVALKEQIAELSAGQSAIVEALIENEEKQAADIEAKVTSQFEALVTGLKKSTGQVVVGDSKKHVYQPQNVAFKDRLADIGKNTRQF